MSGKKYVLWFEELRNTDVAIVGGKNASLGEMYSKLKALDIRVPDGFAVHIDAFRDALSDEDRAEMKKLLDPLKTEGKRDYRALANAGKRCRKLVLAAGLPEEAERQIREACEKLKEKGGNREEHSVAVRSSATAEDLPTASFAGEQRFHYSH